ncbi:MAG: hemolysin-type calcium-binding protein [Alphaproteobacteria bacterium]|nr:MAG: hemolysin-type calcium-binding protein [Alphaproteobacteria bacterium]
MMTGFHGTFVISWAQTEIDGLPGAAPTALGVGANWRWHGRAVRIDGPQEMIRLQGAAGQDELHRHAAARARKLIGQALADAPGASTPLDDEEASPASDHGFELTDGRRTFEAILIETGPDTRPLVMFVGEVPPPQTDLWVVRLRRSAAAVNRLTDQPTGVICFIPGTRIRTERGDVPIEEIEEGERVQTKDDGLQEVLWKGQKQVSGARLFAMPELRPIRLRAGALGVDRPDEDLVVSPRHRLLVKGERARALFNTDEVLVSARDLIDDRTIVRDLTMTSVKYVHLLLPRHEIVFANGLETESFHPAGEALESVAAAERARLAERLPGLESDPMTYGDYARRTLNRAEAAILRGA